MIIGERLKHLREEKNMSQGEIEEKTGLLRCYVSRVENGHTVPAIETLEKFARALDVELYQLFTEDVRAKHVSISVMRGKKSDRVLEVFRRQLEKLSDEDQKFIIKLASMYARRMAA